MSRFSNKQLAIAAISGVILIGAIAGFFFKNTIEMKYADALELCEQSEVNGALAIMQLDKSFGRWVLSKNRSIKANFCLLDGHTQVNKIFN